MPKYIGAIGPAFRRITSTSANKLAARGSNRIMQPSDIDENL
jgi:hypothetical protein